MSPETRERIAAVIEMSHYRPSSIAQSLKAKQSYQIGVVVADVSSPFSAALIRGHRPCAPGEQLRGPLR